MIIWLNVEPPLLRVSPPPAYINPLLVMISELYDTGADPLFREPMLTARYWSKCHPKSRPDYLAMLGELLPIPNRLVREPEL